MEVRSDEHHTLLHLDNTGKVTPMITLVFSPTLGGGCWQVFDDTARTDNPRIGVVVRLAFPSRSRISRSVALSHAKNIVEQRGELSAWITPAGDRWMVDLDVLRGRFEFLKAFAWLRGRVAVEPEHEERDDVFAGSARQAETVTLRLDPEIIEMSSAHVRRHQELSDEVRERVLSALWILECDDHAVQGTAFSLADGRMVTCEHVVCHIDGARSACTKIMAFRASEVTNRRAVHAIAAHAVVDLALLELEGGASSQLLAGRADKLTQMDRVWVAGFPNYHLGDTGFVSPGVVTAFRMFSGVRRLLTDARIVAGSSGGPAFLSDGSVIGVAVTGAKTPDDVDRTENHGLIPIDALQFVATLQ